MRSTAGYGLRCFAIITVALQVAAGAGSTCADHCRRARRDRDTVGDLGQQPERRDHQHIPELLNQAESFSGTVRSPNARKSPLAKHHSESV